MSSDKYKSLFFPEQGLLTIPQNNIPDGQFLLPVCTTRDRLHETLSVLWEGRFLRSDNPDNPESAGDVHNIDHMWDILEALAFINNPTGAVCFPVENCEDGCREYAPNSRIIDYAPNDPFRTPGYTPPGYARPPWYTNPPIPFPGVLPSDAMVDFLAIPNIFAIPTAGFPRFRVNVSGTGEIEIELVQIPQGGLVLITVDDDPLSVEFIDLTSVGVTEIISVGFVLAALGIETDAQAVNTTVWEHDFTEPGNHHVDVTFIPNISVSDEFILGFGGGLRRVSLCGLSEQVTAMPIAFRFTETCMLEVSYNGTDYMPVDGWSEFAASCFTGAPGATGLPGADGASPEMRVSDGFVQWRQDDNSPSWTNLYQIEGGAGAGTTTDLECRYARSFINSAFEDHFEIWLKAISNAVASSLPLADTQAALRLLIGYESDDDDFLTAFDDWVMEMYLAEIAQTGYLEILALEMTYPDVLQSVSTRLACVLGAGLEFCPPEVTAFLYRYENWFNTTFWYSAIDPLFRVMLTEREVLDEMNVLAGANLWKTCDFLCEDSPNKCDDFPPGEPPEPWSVEFNFQANTDGWFPVPGGANHTVYVPSVGYRPAWWTGAGTNRSCVAIRSFVFAAGASITKIGVRMTNAVDDHVLRVSLRRASNGVFDSIEGVFLSPDFDYAEVDVISAVEYDQIIIGVERLFTDCQDDATNQTILEYAVIEGIGDNPF